MKNFFTLIFAGFISVASAQEKTVVFEQTFPAGKELEFTGYVRSVQVGSPIIAALKTFRDVKLKLEAEVSASSPEALFGAKFKPYLSEGKAPALHDFCWKQKTADNFLKYSVETSFHPEYDRNLITGGTLLFYNSTKKGTLKIRFFKLTAVEIEEKTASAETRKPAKTIVNDGTVPDRELEVKRDFFPAGVYYYTSEKALQNLAEKRKISTEESKCPAKPPMRSAMSSEKLTRITGQRGAIYGVAVRPAWHRDRN